MALIAAPLKAYLLGQKFTWTVKDLSKPMGN